MKNIENFQKFNDANDKTGENTSNCASPCQAAAPANRLSQKKNIFRFCDKNQDGFINLEHVYKVVREGKKISFLPVGFDPSTPIIDTFEFDTEESAKRGYEFILYVLSSDTIEK